MNTNTAEPSAVSMVTRARRAFRGFRWSRPFWAGLFTMIAGLPIAYFPYRNVNLGDLSVRMSTTAGAGSLVIGVLLVVLGLTMWFQPHARIFAGVAAIMLALVSLIVSNIGGFLLGFLFGLIGGALSIAWMPGEDKPADSEAEDREPEGREPGGREPVASAAGTGSALAAFDGTAREPGTEPEKGGKRAE